MTGFSFDLDGRVALVTGASSGLGRRFALVLAASGARVVIGARRVELLEALAEEIVVAGGEALPVALDVADEASIIAAYDAAAARFGPVDTVIANAGLNVAGSALGLAADAFDRMVAVNLRGVFLTVREGARRMIAAGSAERWHGRIVIISSITAHQPAAGIAPYSATKAAVAQMGRSLARDWAMKGINVNIVCPGYVATEMNEAIWDAPAGQSLLAGFPRQRVMDDDALDPMILYLASDRSRQVTGSVFTIDDGQTL
ncbi:MAG: SDR family NAD(P)-dependent oxidoreductase [Sphingomonas sp.]|uniref:SDR family NAD(P)-dependent oxidoreductase n=1 Tax=Sphingomonas sp. TaxID=28214 RepID=UPI002275AA94|nr:SDR family NAD(P)-dependent oxidoreductase [Sphingomonas sp.]MCX8474652.1 SDR family NAD(P)-dependent oxidoreductase [Sphingomonas sp.]